jgi:glycosyltransferase involved in cell wall biosynthesis
VSLVIPAKNEARNLPWVLERIPDCVDEVILVDGFSTDATVAMAEFCRPNIRHVNQKRRGKGAGLLAGFEQARGDYVLMIDADGSMDPEEIPRYIWYLDHGFDFVKGSRFVAGGGSLDITPLRRLGNWGLMMIAKVRFGTQLTDLCYGYCGFHRRWLPSLGLSASGFEIETEMTLNALTAGLRIAEVPSLETPRRSGHSNLRTFRDGWRVLRTILRTPRSRPSVVEPSLPKNLGPALAPELPDTQAQAG